MVTPAVRREVAAHLVADHQMSQRRACRVLGVGRSSVRYRTRQPPDGPERERLRALAAERRRFGYRRLTVLLRREGVCINHKRVYRMYTDDGLPRRRRGRRDGHQAHPVQWADGPCVAGRQENADAAGPGAAAVFGCLL
ncbi:putative transcriptional regulator [Roseospira marina]|nr:putative transcriptional regulator [Roseospira marina]MBB5085496.1 putative transcriptional regulator [Roseospira marina]